MATFSIPNVSLRPRTDERGKMAYRPRYAPGPIARKRGDTPRDLKHPDGSWYSIQEASEWQRNHKRALDADKAVAVQAIELDNDCSIHALLRSWLAAPGMDGKAATIGKMQIKAIAVHTAKFYAQWAKVLAKHNPLIASCPASELDREIVKKLFESLWQARGLASARAAIATLSASITWGMAHGHPSTKGLVANPCFIEMPGCPPRVRCGEPKEMERLVAAADAIGRPEIGDAIMLGLWTGQRQADRLALIDNGLVDGRRIFEQHKTGAIVAIAESAELGQRLAAGRRRRADLGNKRVISDERTGAEFSRRWYTQLFDLARDAAVAGVFRDGACLVPPTPSLADFRDQDLRDTAVTWMARAGATVPEICAVSGHSLQSSTRVLTHYLAMHPELADSAISKMAAWYIGAAK
jgi:hypothetical protein